MKTLFFTLAILLLGNNFTDAQYNYPKTKTVDVKEKLWGVSVEDPYRWLEDIKNQEVLDWMKAQADFTNAEIAKIPNQDILFEKLKATDKMRSVRYSPLAKAGGKYFYEKRFPEEQVSKLYFKDIKTGKETLVFDPENFIAGKIFDYRANVSHDGTKIGLEISESGSEVGDIYFYDVASGKLMDEKLLHSSWSSFVGDSNSDYTYVELKSYDVHDKEVLLNMPNKLHKIGTPTSSDKIIVSAKNNPELNMKPNEIPMISVFSNSDYMFAGKYSVENNLSLFYALKSDLHKSKINWKPLCSEKDQIRSIEAHKDDLYLLTTKNNPYFNIIKVDMKNPDLSKAKMIFQGTKEWKLSYLSSAKDFLIFDVSKNELVRKTKYLDFKTGEIKDVKIPVQGNIAGFGYSKVDNEILLSASGWDIPFSIYSYDLNTGKQTENPFKMDYNYPFLKNLVVKEVEVKSHDGAMVPVSILYDKTKAKLDGTDTGYLFGYGSYGISITPSFRATLAPLLEYGVVFAIAHVRGGGEKGDDWYLAGKKTTKPNTWKDFIAAAEYLIQNKYTTKEKLAITGGSAGGILVGRAVTERPDLFKVAIPTVGCMNTLRAEFSPNGPVNIPEFGTVTIEEEFKALLEMDAYQKTKKGVKYPAQLITTGFNDPRVASYIPAKYAAKMQALNGSKNPIFLDVNYKAGHFGATAIDEYFREEAKQMAFVLWQTGHPDFQRK